MSEAFLALRSAGDMIKMHIGLHVKYPLYLSDFNETWIFLTGFKKIPKYQISWKFFQWELSCSMHTKHTWRSWDSFIILRERLKTQTTVQHIVVIFVNSITTCTCAIPVNVPKGLKHVRIMWGCHQHLCMCIIMVIIYNTENIHGYSLPGNHQARALNHFWQQNMFSIQINMRCNINKYSTCFKCGIILVSA